MNHRWNSYFAVLAVAWYAFHPAIAETINYIIARSDVLSTFFIIVSFAVFVFYPRQRKYYIYVLPALIGVFAKETVLMLIPLLFFYVVFFEKNFSIYNLFKKEHFKTSLNVVLHLLPLVLVLFAAQLYTLARTPANVTGLTNPFFNYLLTQPYVWFKYFSTLFLPVELSADTDLNVFSSFFDERALIGFVFVALLLTAIVQTSKTQRTRGISFGLIWFVFALLPTSLAPLSEVMNDHRMFFPFIGLTFSVVSFIGLVISRYEKRIVSNKSNLAILSTFVLVILGSYAYGTHQRNKVWRDEESLWYDVTVKSPKNGRGLMNYGLTQMRNGKYDSAQAYFERALEYTPRYHILELNLGILKKALNKRSEAEVHYKNAITYAPDLFESYYYYGEFLKESNRLEEARLMGEKAVSLSPYYLPTRLMLLDIYQQLEMWDSLEKNAKETLSFAPQDEAVKQYLEASKRKESKVDALIAQTASSPTAENYLNLSLEFYNKGMFEKCIEACNEALKIKPDYAAAYSNICAAYNNLKEWDKAIDACSKSLKINPDNTLARNNLKWAQNQHK